MLGHDLRRDAPRRAPPGGDARPRRRPLRRADRGRERALRRARRRRRTSAASTPPSTGSGSSAGSGAPPWAGCRPASAAGWPWPSSWPAGPQLWLLDEPHAGLDAGARALLGELVAEAVADGATVLLASHEPEASLPLADRVVSLAGGRVVGGARRAAAATRRRRRARSRSGRFAGRRPCGVTRVLVAGKDLRIELRSRVVLNQVVPFAVLVLVLFAFALGPDRAPMVQAAPGLFWVAVLFASVLAVQRSFALEAADGRPGRAAPVGARPGRGLPRQGGRRGRCSWSSSRSLLTAGVVLLYGVARPFLRVDRRGRRSPGRPAWPRRAPSTAPWPPGCGCARRCCRSCSCPSWHRCCWPGRGRGRRRSGPAPGRRRRPVAAPPARLRRRLPGRRRRHLRSAAGGVVTADDARRAVDGAGAWSARATWVVRGLGISAAAGVAGGHRLAGAVGDAARPGPGQPRPAGLRPPAHRLGGALPGLRRRRGVEPAVAVAPDAQPVLGPAGGVRGRGGRRLHRAHAGARARSGAGRPGGCGGRGTPGSPPRRCCSCCSSATWRCAGCPADPDARARRCAVGALVAAVDVPIVHFSVDWWQTLHQGATVLNANLSPTIHGSMAWTLLLGFVAFTLVFVWMLAVRYRIEVLSERLEGAELDDGAARALGRGRRPRSAGRRRGRAGSGAGRHRMTVAP